VRKELPTPPIWNETDHDIDDVEFPKYLQQEFGIQPGIIHVREFSIPEEGIAIYQFPKDFRDFMEPQFIDQWKQLGQFVLECGNDFWLNAEGEVVSS
jgi:hypothetical protein